LKDYNPIANKESVIVEGKARFTVLAPQLIRMEFDTLKKFEDRASLSFVNRNLTKP